MKLKSILSMAAAALVLASCQTPSGEKLADIDNAGKADSLMYIFGQMRGAEFKKMAERDTTLDSSEARRAYIAGIKAGLKAVKEDQNAYNQGVYLGMQMAMNMAQFKKDYNVNLSHRVFVEGVAEALSDSTLNPQALQADFYAIMNDFNTAKENADKAAASKALEKAAAEKKFNKITDQLYGSVPASDQPKLKDGDKVKISAQITTAAGKSLNAPVPPTMTLSERMSESPIYQALISLASGQKGEFLTTAVAMFGNRCSQFGLEPSDVLSLTLTGTVETPEEAPAK